jgi:hypothetical protein
VISRRFWAGDSDMFSAKAKDNCLLHGHRVGTNIVFLFPGENDKYIQKASL